MTDRCSHHGTAIDCPYHNLSQVPANIPTDTTSLQLSYNKIRTLYRRAFVNLTSLQAMSLNNNPLRTIHRGSFVGLSKLQQLDLSTTELQTIPSGVFSDLLALTSIHLHNNPFDDAGTYPFDALRELRSVKSLHISVWDSLSFNVSLAAMTSLEELYVSTYHWQGTFINNNTFVGFNSTQIKYLICDGPIYNIHKNALSHFRNIRGLQITRAHMSAGAILVSMYALQGMTMEYIRIEHVSDKEHFKISTEHVKYLQNICVKELSIRNSLVVTIEPRVTLMWRTSCIETLDLSWNSIGDFGFLVYMSTLSDIRHFNLSRNTPISSLYRDRQKRFSIINAVEVYLPKTLESIDISYSMIRLFRQNISLIGPSLRFVDVSNMEDFYSFRKIGGLFELKILNISSTICQYPAMDMLDDMKALTHFIGRNTKLGQGIEFNLTRFFIGLTSLETLDLSSNIIRNANSPFLETHRETVKHLIFTSMNLTSIPVNAVYNLKKLETLDLRNNNMVNIDLTGREFLQNFNKTRLIFLQKNPFLCTCVDSSLGFLRWMHDYSSLIADYHSIMCRAENGSDVNLENVVKDYQYFYLECKSSFILKMTISMSAVFIVAMIILVIIYKHRYLVSYTLSRIRKTVHGYSQVSECKYDCFLCFSSEDSSWVKMVLYDKLTENNDLNICVYDKDFDLGVDIHECIYDAIDHSRRILFVVTHNFLRSTWGNREIEMAKIHMITTEQHNKIIVLLKDKIDASEMPKTLRWIWDRNVCLEWPHENDFTCEQELERRIEKVLKRIRKSLNVDSRMTSQGIQMS